MTSADHRKLGRYELIRVLGKGAMGLVYEARDPNLERRVAIKTIKVENLSEEAAVEYESRFRTEARSAARLQHPNIVSVYDSDRDGDTAYLVMEFVQGEDLKHHLDAGTRFSLAQSLVLAGELLSALDYAHQQNIVHRDVKPANLLIEASGRVKLADFGVARIQDAAEATRTKGSMVGTLKYMSPEQVQGLAVDARSDLFAAAVVLYQLLTGRRPFDGDTDFAVIQQIVALQPTAPSSINPQLPAGVDAVMERALAKARESRFASAREFALALQEATGQVLDHSIVPPAGLGGAATGSSTGSRPLRTGTGTGNGSGSGHGTVRFGPGVGDDPGSTMTQELELVYWKDVRDSDDEQDVEGFLQRFPSGIYADLARRRLRKLAGQNTATRSGSTTEDTRMDGATLVVEPDSGQGTGAGTGTRGYTGTDDGATMLALVPAVSEPVVAQAAAAPLTLRAPATVHEAPDSPALPRPARSRRPVVIAALAAAVVVGVLAYQRMSGDAAVVVADAPPLAAATPAEPASGAASAATMLAASAAAMVSSVAQGSAAAASPPASSPSASPSSASSSPARPAASASAARNAVRAASAPKPLAAETTAGNAAAATATSPTAARPAPLAKALVPESNARPAAAAMGNPAQACTGRVLLGYQVCLSEQCALPAFATHPMCTERRAADKAQRDAQNQGRN